MKTALKPRWIAMLILAMTIAAVFVLLSQWQFNSSRQEPPPAPSSTENVLPLTGILQPLTPLYASRADQMVSIEGSFLPDTRILVQNRVLDGQEGLWVVQGLEVDGADGPGGASGGEAAEPAVIPVVIGWVPDPDRAVPIPEQTGPVSVVGRLLPPEAPEVRRPVDGEVPTLSTAELSNLWDTRTYSAFVVATQVASGGVEVPFAAGMEQVVVGPQPQETPVNWLNIFYAIEWVVFAGFAFFLWWRLVADDHRRSLEDAADAEEEARAATAGALSDGDPGESPGSRPSGAPSEARPVVQVPPTSGATPSTESSAHRD
ncbi:SURF1 family protein [Vibrio cholerae]|nr:SURF1 family protein [Vibrio cholerae]